MQLDVESKEALEDLLSKVGALLPVEINSVLQQLHKVICNNKTCKFCNSA